MKNLLKYELFEDNKGNLNKEQIEFLNKYAEVWEYNEKTGLIDCGHFNARGKNLENLLGIKFGKVDFFSCSNNQLTSLEGAPEEVKTGFYCYSNQLKNLKGSPKIVGTFFNCSDNQLKNLEGAPTEVGGKFQCDINELVTLEHLFKIDIKDEIESDFYPETIDLIRSETNNGLEYKEALLKVWNKIYDKDKKILINDLPDSPLGRTIKKSNKFGMNI